ncbi:MAG: hypothetical protein JWM11_3345 [Planctomycetaceae bacterium]|nr:hypothetical protein [Planctomycetaceae bacterium]
MPKSSEPIRGVWPVVRVTIEPGLLAKIEALRLPGETVQTTINRILAGHFGLEPVIRPRGNPTGKKGTK